MPSCRAYGHFTATKPKEGNTYWDKRNDGLKIICTTPTDRMPKSVYEGIIGAELFSGSMSDRTDTIFMGKSDAPREVRIENLDWNTLRGSYRAVLAYGLLPYETNYLRGQCEFRHRQASIPTPAEPTPPAPMPPAPFPSF
jgi:hypothetical protein